MSSDSPGVAGGRAIVDDPPAIFLAWSERARAVSRRFVAATREKLEAAIKDQNKIDIYVVIAKEQRRADALEQIQALRDRGYRVDYPLTPAKVARQFQTAEELGAGLRSRLNAEEVALAGIREQLASERPDSDAHGTRVADFNARVTRANADAQQFNKEAERYNLMMSYPDGLDEESLVQARTALVN